MAAFYDYHYDRLGRVEKIEVESDLPSAPDAEGADFTFTQDYDLLGARDYLQVNRGLFSTQISSSYHWDAVGRLFTIEDAAYGDARFLGTYVYDGSQLTQIQRDVRDPENESLSVIHTTLDRTPGVSLEIAHRDPTSDGGPEIRGMHYYEFDGFGRVDEYQPYGGPSVFYDYDGRGQLRSATVDSQETTFGYDSAGNPISANTQYSPGNRLNYALTTVPASGGGVQGIGVKYQYDREGNRIQEQRFAAATFRDDADGGGVTISGFGSYVEGFFFPNSVNAGFGGSSRYSTDPEDYVSVTLAAPSTAPGVYQISVTFPADAQNTDEALYSLWYDGVWSSSYLPVSQQVSPTDIRLTTVDGVTMWKVLGTVTIPEEFDQELTLRITNIGAGRLAFDAVRIEKLAETRDYVYDYRNRLTNVDRRS